MTVLLADHDPAWRAQCRKVLERHRTNHIIVGEADNGVEAVKLARQLKPDLIIITLWMPHMDGVEATELIRKVHPAARIIGVSDHDSTIARLNFVKAGAITCLSKDNIGNDLKLWMS